MASAPPQLARLLTLCWLLAPAVALAHVGQGDVGGGFLAGVEHPIFGLDHVIAMVAVGMWGAQLGAPALWVLPVTFPLVMAFGGVLGAIGIPIPGIEIGIAVSAVVLGGMVAFAARPPLWVAAILVGQAQPVFAQSAQHARPAHEHHLGAACLQAAAHVAADAAGAHDEDHGRPPNGSNGTRSGGRRSSMRASVARVCRSAIVVPKSSSR